MNMLVLIILFVVELIFITLIVLIARSGLKDKINRTLIYFLVAFALWALSNYLSNLTELSTNKLLMLNQILFAVSIICTYTLQSFVTVVTRQKNGLFIRLSSLTVSIFAIWASFSSGVVSNTFIEESSVVGIEFGELSFLYFLAVVYLIGLIIYRLALGVHSKSRRSKIYSKTLLSSIGISIGAVLITNVLVPLAFNNFSFTTIGLLAGILIIAGIGYGIVKHGMFDIKLAVARSVAYSLVLTTLIGLYFLFALLLSGLFNNTFVDPNHALGTVIVSLGIAIVFQPIRNFFDKVTNKIFYKDSYIADIFYSELSRLLTSTDDLRLLLEKSANKIADTLKSEQAFFFIYTQGTNHISSGTSNHIKIPIADTRLIGENKGLSKNIIVTTLLDEEDPLRRMMLSHRIALTLPLIRDEKILGYFFLGEHKSSDYTQRDRRLLTTIADELTIGIQNVLSVEEVRELNSTLQQRVNEATKELRASNAQLQRLDKAKDEFVSMASHQLRTPLTSVKGYISMVLEGDAGKVSDMQTKLLSEAFTSSERMVHLINDFLNVSRLQTGKFMIDKRPVDLAKVVGQELESLSTNASSRNLSFVYKPPKDFPILDLDEDKMRQVIMNFSDNAIYYSPESSKIHVGLTVIGNEAVFTVKDTGIGVPRQEQSQLFSKFYRASNARKQRPDGTGVGLFLAKKVIDSHDGTVIFESTEGKGSTFGFKLPIDKLLSVSNTNNLDNQDNNKDGNTASN